MLDPVRDPGEGFGVGAMKHVRGGGIEDRGAQFGAGSDAGRIAIEGARFAADAAPAFAQDRLVDEAEDGLSASSTKTRMAISASRSALVTGLSSPLLSTRKGVRK